MSSRQNPKTIRTVADYLASAKRMAPFAPSLRKYCRRKTLSPQEKSAITRKEKILRTAYNLKPVSKKLAKELKASLYAPGIRAVQFNNISPHAKIRRIKKDVLIESNGRDWLYWKLPDTSRQEFEDAAEDLFGEDDENDEQVEQRIIETFDIEKLEKLAKRAYQHPFVKTVHLWTKQGRVGEGFNTIGEFMQWLYHEYSKYQDTERWVNGIAFLLEDKDKRKRKVVKKRL